MTPVHQVRWLRSSAPPRDLQPCTQALWWHQRQLGPCHKRGQHRTEENQHLHKALWTVNTFHHRPVSMSCPKVNIQRPPNTSAPNHPDPSTSVNIRFIKLDSLFSNSLTLFCSTPRSRQEREWLPTPHWCTFSCSCSCACSVVRNWLERASSVAVPHLPASRLGLVLDGDRYALYLLSCWQHNSDVTLPVCPR